MDYITYEGLRHCQTFSLFHDSQLDYITYEGLRRNKRDISISIIKESDYITYEGLRL